MPTGASTIQLARIFGIRIGVSTSWFLILFIVIYLLSGTFQDQLDGTDTQAYVVAVIAALLFFASLLAHELGHALAARHFGIQVAGIELWLLGGLAKMSRDSQNPREEFVVAAAGPAVTAAIVVVCAAVGMTLEGVDRFADVAMLEGGVTASPALVLLSWLATVNVALFVFNLIPAFPLDGGRLARAGLWKLTGDRGKATRWSGRAGQVFAYALAAAGIFLVLIGYVGNGIWLVVLAFFLGSSARGAVLQSDLDERLEGITVGDVMDPTPITLPAGMTVLEASESSFEVHEWQWVAVTEPDGRFIGVAARDTVARSLAEGRPALTLRQVLESEDAGPLAIGVEEPLEALLGTEGMRRIGAVFAIDGEGVLRGVVTLDQVRRALTPAAGR